jgi:hypothetical protein
MFYDTGTLSLGVALKVFEILANRGFVHPKEIDSIDELIATNSELNDPEVSAMLANFSGRTLASLRSTAAERWNGPRDETGAPRFQ